VNDLEGKSLAYLTITFRYPPSLKKNTENLTQQICVPGTKPRRPARRHVVALQRWAFPLVVNAWNIFVKNAHSDQIFARDLQKQSQNYTRFKVFTVVWTRTVKMVVLRTVARYSLVETEHNASITGAWVIKTFSPMNDY
jgi:hypothetical protein